MRFTPGDLPRVMRCPADVATCQASPGLPTVEARCRLDPPRDARSRVAPFSRTAPGTEPCSGAEAPSRPILAHLRPRATQTCIAAPPVSPPSGAPRAHEEPVCMTVAGTPKGSTTTARGLRPHRYGCGDRLGSGGEPPSPKAHSRRAGEACPRSEARQLLAKPSRRPRSGLQSTDGRSPKGSAVRARPVAAASPRAAALPTRRTLAVVSPRRRCSPTNSSRPSLPAVRRRGHGSTSGGRRPR